MCAKRDENLVVAPGHIFAVTGDEKVVDLDRKVRVSFSWEQEGRLAEGIRRLSQVIANMQRFEGQQEKGMAPPSEGSSSLVDQYG